MTALCVNELITEEEIALAVKLCDTFGKTEVIPEHLMDRSCRRFRQLSGVCLYVS